MKRQGKGKRRRARGYRKQLLHAMSRYLPHCGMPLVSDDDRIRWTDRLLALCAILVSWSSESTLRDAFDGAREAVVAMYDSRKRPGKTARGFFDALRERSPQLVARLKAHCQKTALRVAAGRWRYKRWVVMAADGSRVNVPRTAANEQAFGCAGVDKTTPQQWVTSVFHVQSGLLWDYRTGSATASEQEDLRDMLTGLPARTLLLIDAGYRGFSLLGSILDSGRDFIVRVGTNTTLLKDLDYDVRERGSTVWLWPKTEQGQRPPLKLRKVEFKSKGHRVCLLSSVLSADELSDAQIKRLYRQRWVIEVQYRNLKQTMEHRTLLSDSPQAARAELDWCLMGLRLLELMQVGSRRGKPSRPYSLATSLRVVRKAMRSRGRVPAGGLQRQLRQALLDGYERRKPKQARDYPCKKRLKPCGHPRIRMATGRETLKARAFFAKKVPA